MKIFYRYLIRSLTLGTILIKLTGHLDMVTAVVMTPLKSEHTNQELSESGNVDNIPTDMIVSVSDDKTARVYHVNTRSLMK